MVAAELLSQALAYYRCRLPAEYALANKVDHPRNVFVRERDVVPALEEWLHKEFAPPAAAVPHGLHLRVVQHLLSATSPSR